MVAHNTERARTLTPDELDDVAEVRARSGSWEAAAQVIAWDVKDLKRAARHNPDYHAALEYAKQEAAEEADAEAQQKLRAQLRSADPVEARKAATTLVRARIAARRDKTQHALAQLRAQTQVTVEHIRKDKAVEVERLRQEGRKCGRCQKAQEPDGPRMGTDGYPEPELTEEQVRKQQEIARKYDAIYAEEAARSDAVVYLWGGCHKLGDTAPDQTDTPLRLVWDATAPGGQRLYWALTNPPPVIQPLEGPFLPPPGCRPATYPDTLYQDG